MGGIQVKKRVLSVLLLVIHIMQFIPAYADFGFSSDPDAIEQAAKSVLMLQVFDADNEMIATGSGFVAFNNRTIITNYHVIEEADWMMAISDDGYQYMVTKVLAADEEKDIAICSFMSPTDLQPLEFNTDGELKRAENVVAIGSPRGFTNTVSLGNISAIYRDEALIQFTAPISYGSSGGALFDDSGRVIGITSSGFDDAQNLNFAVHISEVEALCKGWNGLEVSFDEFMTISSVTSAPAPTATPTPKPTYEETTLKPQPINTPKSYAALKKGSTGDEVKRLQEKLIDLGYLEGDADGVFGTQTELAVTEFNLANIGVDGPVASEMTQKILFDGNPKAYDDPYEVLIISQGASAKTENTKDNTLKICFEVTNQSAKREVFAFELYVYARGFMSNKPYYVDTVKATIKKTIHPQSKDFSDYVILSPKNEIKEVYCGICKVTYSDGTVYTIPEQSIEYSCWRIE